MSISVIIPVYNSRRYIGRAIESVLAQTMPAEQVIVVDDGSEDGTVSIVEAYGRGVELIRQDNAGAGAARNTGIKAARGEWIAFLDADDEWLPEKLELQSLHLQKNPHLKWTTGNFSRCCCRKGHAKTPDLGGLPFEKACQKLSGREYFDSYFQAYLFHAAGHTDTMLIRRDVLLEAGLFDSAMPRINDIDMWLRIAYLDLPIGFLAEPLAIYHLDIPGSIVKKHTDADIISRFIDTHLRLSEKHNMSEQFRPCATSMLGWWISCRLEEENQHFHVRRLLRGYGWLLPRYCRITNYIRTFFPKSSLAYENLKRRIKKRNL